MYYIFAEDNKLCGSGQCKCLNDNTISIEVDEELYNDYNATPNKYILGEKEIELVIDDFEEQEIEETREIPDYEIQEIPSSKEIDDYDEDGVLIGSHIEETTELVEVQTGSHTETVTHTEIVKIGSHTETKIIPYPVINPNYEEEEKQRQMEQFHKDFFNTSLGWVRRKVSMQTGETKDFLADILPILQVGIPILTYTEEGEQMKVLVTEEFIDECKQQVIKDFYGM